ncbi:MAG: isochorismatase family protein [Spirochaetaceae bacterium]
MKVAFMVIDMQKEYFKGSSKESMESAAEYINEVLEYFREKKLPIVWVQDIAKESGVVPGTKGFEVIDILNKSDDELSIYKEYGNTFNKTECGGILKKEGVDVIVLAGYCAENCVLSTYRGALDLDFTPILLKDGIASGDAKNLEFVEKISDTVPYNIVKKLL